jgi:cytochrome c biogenesis protein CcmG/thiol:disulfide interchange protein DsbE
VSTALEEVSLNDHHGKVVLVDFWATWCKPCEEEIPIFIELYDQYRGQGFEVLGISLDDGGLKVVEPFIERLGVNYTVLLGAPEISQKYDIPAMPSAFLIDRDGRIVKVFPGAQGKKATYESELKQLL